MKSQPKMRVKKEGPSPVKTKKPVVKTVKAKAKAVKAKAKAVKAKAEAVKAKAEAVKAKVTDILEDPKVIKAKAEGKKLINFLKENKSKWRYILYGIGGLIVLYFLIYLFSPKPQMPAEYKVIIDSLMVANKELEAKQLQIDSSIQVYESEVKAIDFQVDHIKEKTTIIREYYHEQSAAASAYTPTQLDSFFRNRYNY